MCSAGGRRCGRAVGKHARTLKTHLSHMFRTYSSPTPMPKCASSLGTFRVLIFDAVMRSAMTSSFVSVPASCVPACCTAASAANDSV